MKRIYKFPCTGSIPNQLIGSQQSDTALVGLGERIGLKADITTAPAFLGLGR